MSRKLKGVAAAPGIAIAPLVLFHDDLEAVAVQTVTAEAVPAEITRLDEAIRQASKSILGLRHELATDLSAHDAKIYDAQLALLHDQTFRGDMVHELQQGQLQAEAALQQVIARYERVFESMEDAAMRERAADVRDVGRQVLRALLERERATYTSGGRDYIFAAGEFLPSDAGSLDRNHLRGIVTTRGGKYSHGAILARSLGIPALVGVDDVMGKVRSGALVVLDGDSGQLIIDPEPEELGAYRQRKLEGEAGERRVFEVRTLPSVTPDGIEITLLANVESVRDIDRLELQVASGIGLFRTEFAFMERRQFPREEDQVAMYRHAVDCLGDRPLTFRTLDVGGDKPLGYFRTPPERNPVLGWRGLRISLSWPDIFYTQVRAILRATAGGSARILLPMVTNIGEIRSCRAAIERLCEDLRLTHEPHADQVLLGVMVEVPALVSILDRVLPLVDFLSVGTNDLVQYLLAVDRDNPRVAALYDPYDPAVLRVLQVIARAATDAGKPVSVCGEIAGDHHYTPLLIGLGFRQLSMAPVFLPRVKLMVRSFPVDECRRMVAAALDLESAAEVRRLAREEARLRWASFLSRDAAVEKPGPDP